MLAAQGLAHRRVGAARRSPSAALGGDLAPPGPPMETTGTTAQQQGTNQESGVVTRSVMRGTIPRSKLKPFVFLVRSLCPETGQTPEFREYDRVYNPSPDARGAPRRSIRLRTRVPATRSPSPGPASTSTTNAAGAGTGAGSATTANAAANASSSGGPGSGTGATGATATSNASASNTNPITPSGQWLIYAGLPNRRAPPKVDQRPVTTVTVRDAEPLLAILGCSLAFEYVRRVIRCKTRAGVYIDVFLIERLDTPGDPSSTAALPLGSPESGGVRDQQCVVELWGDDLPSMEPLLSFGSYLSPHVMFK